MSEYNQLRSSLLNKLSDATPEILHRLVKLEGLSIGTRAEIDKVYNDTALNIFSDSFNELERFWLWDENKKRNMLARLTKYYDRFIYHDIAEPYPVSVICALTSVLKQMLEDEAYDWFYAYAYHFQKSRQHRTGGKL